MYILSLPLSLDFFDNCKRMWVQQHRSTDARNTRHTSYISINHFVYNYYVILAISILSRGSRTKMMIRGERTHVALDAAYRSICCRHHPRCRIVCEQMLVMENSDTFFPLTIFIPRKLSLLLFLYISLVFYISKISPLRRIKMFFYDQ